ncbi:hypothetical protein LXL04_014036 [Taraxacum kok-saghyz]
MILCDILIKYIMKYGRTQPIRWQDLQEPFEKEDDTKLNNYKALKNKYDAMRKDYNLWKSLKHGETGLGWVESTKQLNCSDEWWDKKIKENPNVKGFRKKQPSFELQQGCDQIFGDAVASGTDCVAPSMDPIPSNNMNTVILDEDDIMAGDNVATHDDVPTDDGTFFSSQYPQHCSNLKNIGNEEQVYYSNLMSFANDVFSPNNVGGSNQAKKSSKEITKLKPIQMKRNKKESRGSMLFNAPAMNFPKPPEGKCYLVDKGYPDRNGYMVPYSKTRYHQSQFAHEPPNNMQENFNRSHSSLRSYIERSFGILKGQWKILNRMPKFSVKTQIDVIMATFALHNYIRSNSEEATLFDFVEQHPNCVPHDGLCDVRGSDKSNEDFYGGSKKMKQIRNDIAALIWNDRRR